MMTGGIKNATHLALLLLVSGGIWRGSGEAVTAAASSSSPLDAALRHWRNQRQVGGGHRDLSRRSLQSNESGVATTTTINDVIGNNNETSQDETNDAVCSDNVMFVLKDDDYPFYHDESNMQCDYCHNYNVSDFFTIPESGGDLDDIERSVLEALIVETQLYNYSCRNANGCTTCFDNPRSSAAVEEFSEYCGLIETMEYLLVNPDTDDVSVLSSNDTIANVTAIDSADSPLGLYILQLFVGGIQVCLTYDDSSTTTTTATEAGATVCIGANGGGSNASSSQTIMSNGTYGNTCFITYNGVRCNSCSDYVTDNLTSCLTADCSNLGTDDSSLYTAPMDTCSKNNPFVGPLRFIETFMDLENFAATSRPGSCSLNTNGNGDNGNDSGNGNDSNDSGSGGTSAAVTTRLGVYTTPASFQTAAWVAIMIFWAGSWAL